MKLSNLKRQSNNKGTKKRLGRGYGSGKGGHTVGKGQKGQKSRGSGKVNPGFEGGQVPLYKKLPKIATFKQRLPKDVKTVPLVKLNLFKDGSEVTPQKLVDMKILKKLPKHGVKLLGNGKIYKKLKLSGFEFTKSAKEKLEQTGSTVS